MKKNLHEIRDQWENIAKSFYWVSDFLEKYARITSDSLLPSYNSILPLIAYAYMHNSRITSQSVKNIMQKWLYKALLNGNFSGQSDSAIDNCTDIIDNSSTIDFFPHEEIESILRKKLNRITDVNNDIIDGNATLILNLLYLFNNSVQNFTPLLIGNSPEIDHIFPRSKMSRTHKYESGLVNNIGNYMFLEKLLNIDKGYMLPEEYFPLALNQQNDFFERNFIPKDSQLHKPDKFETFVEERRTLIHETIKSVLVY